MGLRQQIELPNLYSHQEDLRDRVRNALAKYRRVILCAQPGVGKTRMSKWILGAAASKDPGPRQSGFSLFAVHRRGLVENASNSFGEHPALPHGMIMSGKTTSFGIPTQVASIDSLVAWFCEGGTYSSDYTFDLVVFDECHSHHAKLQKFLDVHDKKRREMGLMPAYVIGLSATPEGKGLSDVYKLIVSGPPAQWLIDNGYLSGFRYFQATRGDLGVLKKRGSEYTNKSVSEAFDNMAGDLVEDWKRIAEGRPTVGFFPRRKHAKAAMQELRDAGVRAEYVDGETPDEDRNNLFAALDCGDIDYLCNVQIVERGTDIPRVQCVQLCVAVASIVRYRQMIGRGSRTHPEKDDCIVIDHADNIQRLGFFEDDPIWNLEARDGDAGEAGTRPTIECPQCSAIYRGGKCRSCGYEPNAKEIAAQGLEFVGGELVEVTSETQKPQNVLSAERLMISALYRAGKSGKTWKQACGIFRRMNAEQGTTYYVPSRVIVAGNMYRMLRFGSADANRRVSKLFPFTVGGKHDESEYLEGQASDGERLF